MHLPRHTNLWLPGYLHGRLRRWTNPDRSRPQRVWLAVADHFEPLWLGAGEQTACARVRAWREHWPAIARQHTDSAGRPPVYTFYYPEEQYRENFLDALAELTAQGVADVEVHIHHDGEGEADFVGRMARFLEILRTRHGLLREEQGRVRFGFIHGNSALDNSGPGGRGCGLNNEIRLLAGLGCYADFTMPSGASPTQARTVNEIYWAVDDPKQPKSYDRGLPFRPDGPRGDLLMIPGPLAIRFRGRLMPRMDTGEIAGYDLPTSYRVTRWIETAPRLGGDVFIKLFAHGAQERNLVPLLQSGLDRLFTLVIEHCRRHDIELRFVSTWQMYNAIINLGRTSDTRSLPCTIGETVNR